jgi:hypothetical protein
VRAHRQQSSYPLLLVPARRCFRARRPRRTAV